MCFVGCSRVYAWILLILFGYIFRQHQFVKAGGILSLQFYEYVNPTYDKDDQTCCQSSSGASTCRYHCENTFVLCISSSPSTEQDQHCNIVQYTSSIINLDTIWFAKNHRDERLRSPFVYTFNKWNGTVQFDLKVFDGHPSSSNLITNFVEVRNVTAQNFTTSPSLEKITLKKGSRRRAKKFLIDVSVTCNEKYLAPDCSIKYCVPSDDEETGHYNCTATGEKVCLDGWENRTLNCLKKVCVPKNDDINGHFNCSKMGEKVCLDGWENTTLNCLKKMCIPQNDNRNGHYECSDMGKKICLTGWENITMNCLKRICIPHDDDTNGHYECSSDGEKVCLDGWDESSNCTIRTSIPFVNPSTNDGKTNDRAWIYILIAILILLVIVAIIVLLFVHCKKKRNLSNQNAYTTLTESTVTISPIINNNKANDHTALLTWKKEMFSESTQYGVTNTTS